MKKGLLLVEPEADKAQLQATDSRYLLGGLLSRAPPPYHMPYLTAVPVVSNAACSEVNNVTLRRRYCKVVNFRITSAVSTVQYNGGLNMCVLHTYGTRFYKVS